MDIVLYIVKEIAKYYTYKSSDNIQLIPHDIKEVKRFFIEFFKTYR